MNIKDNQELDIQSALNYSEKGIDIFNANDKFFNDLCYNFDRTDGRDIVINDRRKDIYKNIYFCQEGCTYSNIDYNLMAANCICDTNVLQNDEKNGTNNKDNQLEYVNFQSLKKSFFSNLLNFNFDVILCKNLLFDLKILFKNIGFYLTSVMFISQIIILVILLKKGFKSIKNYMLKFKSASKMENEIFYPPKKKKDELNKKFSNKHLIKKIDNAINWNKRIEYIDYFKNYNKQIKMIKINTIKELSQLIKYGNSFENDDFINNKKIIKNNINSNDKNYNRRLKYINPSNHLDLFQDGLQLKIHKKESKENKISSLNLMNVQNPLFNLVPFKKKDHLHRNKIKPISEQIRRGQSSKCVIKEPTNDNNDNLNTIQSKNNKKRKISRKKYKKHNLAETSGENENKNKYKKDKLNDDEELQEIDYENAIRNDKRSCLKMYWSSLVYSQIIINTFCSNNNLDLLIVKISYFIFSLDISFFLNALFYIDDYISKAYYNNGVLDFVSGLPKSFYSSIASLIIVNILKLLIKK